MGIALIVIFVIIMGGTIFWFREIPRQRVNAVASIVTIIGVLGTFIGIAIGLYQFNTANIEASVPKLLEGLKIAFITSILGIIGSIVLKWSALNEREKDGPIVNNLAELLQILLDVEQEEAKKTREILHSIERSFSDKQDDLIRTFNEFADKMTENNTNALIEALEEVMRDFNARINEQFGDNFRQLNEGVRRINKWQE